jgi:hypothetical protein
MALAFKSSSVFMKFLSRFFSLYAGSNFQKLNEKKLDGMLVIVICYIAIKKQPDAAVSSLDVFSCGGFTLTV